MEIDGEKMTVSSDGRLLIRADFSAQIGSGHLMRCLALAQAWLDKGGEGVCMLTGDLNGFQTRMQDKGLEVVQISSHPGSAQDAFETVEVANRFKAQWVIIDGYRFGAETQRIIKENSLRLLFIDDNGFDKEYSADIVLNQNVYAHEGMYRNRKSSTQVLLGTQYALLRREFLNRKIAQRSFPEVGKKILVTLGGADTNNVTLKVVQALEALDIHGVEAVVLVGAANPHFESLRIAVERAKIPIRIERNATNVAELMEWADVAVSASGSTCWELAFMGLPPLLVVLAENQESNAEWLGTQNLAVNLGWHERCTPHDFSKSLIELLRSSAKRRFMADNGRKLVDGMGCYRVVSCL